MFAMGKKRVRYEFKVDVDGKTFACERTVLGTRVLTQSINVIGIGTEKDQADYGGSGGHPVASMEGIARVIATNIIKKCLKSGV